MTSIFLRVKITETGFSIKNLQVLRKTFLYFEAQDRVNKI